MLDASTQMRLTGLATGLDTDAIIKNLGKAHQVRIDAVKKSKQTLLWKQEAYRSTINMVSTLLKSSFNVANPASNFRSPSAFAKFSYNLSLGGSVTEAAKAKIASVVSVTATGDLKNFNQSIQSVAQLATKDTWKGDAVGLQGITTKGFDIEKFGRQTGIGFQASYASFSVSIDGTSKTIQIDAAKIQNIYANSGKYEAAVIDYKNAQNIDGANLNLSKYCVDKGNGTIVSAQQYFDGLISKHFAGTGINSLQDILGNPAISDLVEIDDLNGTVTFNPGNAFDIDTLPIDQEAKDFLLSISDKPFQLKEQAIDIENSYLYFVDAGGKGVYASVSDYLKNAGLDDNQIQAIVDAGGLNSLMSVSDLETLLGSALDNSDGKIAQALNMITAAPLFKESATSDPDAAVKAFAKLVDDEIVKAFGKDYAGTVGTKNGEMTFNRSGSTIVVSETVGFSSSLEAMGLKGGASSRNFNNKTIGDVLGADFFAQATKRTITFAGPTKAINIDISSTDTLTSVISKINNSGAGVNLSYDNAGDRFVLASMQEGSANNIKNIQGDAAQFFEALGIGKAVELEWHVGNNENGPITHNAYMLSIDGQLDKSVFGSGISGAQNIVVRDSDGNVTQKINYTDDAAIDAYLASSKAGTREEGQNLIAMINGEKYIRQTNAFTHEGMTFKFTDTFNAARYDADTGNFLTDAEVGASSLTLDPAIKIQVDKNTSEVMDSIKAFVEEYNKIVDHLNGLLTEKRDRKYKPLTDEERAGMKDEEIKLYEDKTKAGLMANDSELRKLLDQMRSAIYQKVNGVGLSMADIGITTTANWKDGGRLEINETKLSDAIDNRYDEVVALFTKPETKIPEVRDAKGKVIKKAVITEQGGISHQLYNLFNDAAGTTGDKGYLLNKAGMVGDGTQNQNEIQKKLTEYDKRLDTLLDRWYRQEDRYYKMFARMESAMMKMQSQQNSLASLMAQSGGK